MTGKTLNVDFFLDKIDTKNIIDNHLKLILNELAEYLCFYLSYMSVNILLNFSTFLFEFSKIKPFNLLIKFSL